MESKEFSLRSVLFSCTFLFWFVAMHAESNTADAALQKCQEGKPSEGLALLEGISTSSINDQTDPKNWLVTSECFRLAGDSERALWALEKGQEISKLTSQTSMQITFIRASAIQMLGIGDTASALQTINEGIAQAEASGETSSLSDLELIKGNIYTQTGSHSDAQEQYKKASETARTVGSASHEATALLEQARSLLVLQRSADALKTLKSAQELIDGMDADAKLAQNLATLGELYYRHDQQLSSTANSHSGITALGQANELAIRFDDQRTQSSALGYMGAIAQTLGQTKDALAYTRAAVDLAHNAQALDLLYRWQWQSAQILEQSGNEIASLDAYLQAIDTLEKVRPYLAKSDASSFNREIAPLYTDTATLMLKKSDGLEDQQANQAVLKQVRNTIERFKVAEVLDYFGDECVVDEGQELDIENLADDVAVVYPVVLDDRLEVLTSYRGQIVRHTSAVSRRELSRAVTSFRRGLVRRPTHRYRESGEQLYQWLLAPVAEDLKDNGISTLVFVADGPLRTIPISALYHDNRFLIEDFAVANSIGLSLTSPKPLGNQNIEVMAGGLSLPVDGFSPLPAVERELDMLAELYGATQLRDEEFLVAPIENELTSGNYSIVHIATHGQFKSDYRDSFLLAFDGRMDMDSLESSLGMRRYSNTPVELLMLSACETAVGDDRAALGLAGVALKAGARSAVATLWSINDNSSAELVKQFYQSLKSGQYSKAQTLRRAQLELMKDETYSHPFYWSPFLLIGNWL
ncbi:MAG: CHAT domain-containing protein [Halioglobus sp.]